jgi:hypothetical protein
MNDDFLNHHRQQPDPKFVERLHQQINFIPQRRFPMYKRPTLIIALALILAAALTFTFSSTVRAAARAALESILTLNGATVSMDDETGHLVVTGNPDAIAAQSNHMVTLKDDQTGETSAIAVAGQEGEVIDGEMLDTSELFNRYPDLILPNVPDGYILQSQGQITESGDLVFTWMDATGNTIFYERSTSQIVQFYNGHFAISIIPDQNNGNQDGIPLESGTTITNETFDSSDSPKEGSAEPDSTLPTPPSFYIWEGSGYYHMLIATDSINLDIDALKDMAP